MEFSETTISEQRPMSSFETSSSPLESRALVTCEAVDAIREKLILWALAASPALGLALLRSGAGVPDAAVVRCLTSFGTMEGSDPTMEILGPMIMESLPVIALAVLLLAQTTCLKHAG